MTLYANIACDVPRTPQGLAVGWQARALWYETLLFCRENLTDGAIASVQLSLISPDMPIALRRKAVAAWVEVGWVEEVDGGWRIPLDSWTAYNPLKADIEAKRAADAERKRLARERRIQEESGQRPRGIRADKQRSPGQPESESESESKREPEPKPEPKGQTSSVSQTATADSTPTDDDFHRTIELIIDAKALEHPPHSNPKRWRIVTRSNTITEDGELVQRMLNNGDQPETVAHFVLGHGIGAEREQQADTVPWCTTDCPQCDGDAWIRTNNGLAPCPNRTT